MTDYENYLVVMKCRLNDDMKGMIRKAIYLSEADEYLNEGWEFTNTYDEKMYNLMKKEETAHD